jgi:hypothetical protein
MTEIVDREYYEGLLAEVVRERENYNGMHQAAVMEIDRLRAVLEQIATMDPWGVRADDLGRAARIAREAIGPVSKLKD